MNFLVTESERFSPVALERIRPLGEVRVMDLDRANLLSEVSSCGVLWIRLRHRIDGEVFDAAPNLRVIVSPTTGLNHIDLEAAEERGITVLSLKGEVDFLQRIRATAEHTLCLALALVRNLKPAVESVEQGIWDRDSFRGGELLEKTVGIVGYGRLGRIVADYFHAFGARMLATDPNVEAAADHVELTGLDRLLAESDLVSLHVNLDGSTEGFFDADAIARMKPGAWLINTARGELLDETALLDALREGRLSGAALDVVCDERPAGMRGHPLIDYARDHDHLVITPHIGGCTVESMEKTEVFMAEKLARFLTPDQSPT